MTSQACSDACIHEVLSGHWFHPLLAGRVQNVPVDFQLAHGYAERSKVELRMRGKSWLVHLKHSPRSRGRPRASLRYGWHQFLVDNRLTVGDTCFFRALRAGGEDHELKVQVRKLDGTFVE